MFVRRRAPLEYSWELLSSWLSRTEEDFYELYEKRRLLYRASDEMDKRPGRGVLSPREAWEEVRAISAIRQELIANGWLPPRERDILEREGSGRGKLFEGTPTKWAPSRRYEEGDFLTGGWKHFADE